MDETQNNTGIIVQCMEDVMHNCMMPYSEHVILDRALPRVEDGLKPVQRRILYSMNELGVTSDKPYRKSARIVGDCLGKYHPHGDRSVYDAMVRLAQPFNMRQTLVDGHGNFGSVDGDSAAAMRYTEARLAPLAAEMLRDLEKDTVHWSLNFDDTTKEPDTLPARFPNLLVNGAYGIAVGLATNIPPHNLGEVIDGVIAYIDNNRITLKEMMKIIKGPDFPTGGGCVCGDELLRAYETGKGRLVMCPKIRIERGENDKRNIVITELPYQVNKKNLLESIVQLREEKKGVLAGIAEICDESDRDGMRAVIKVKRDVDPKPICDILFKSTSLMTTFGVNMVAIANGKPQQLGLMQIISYYVEYQREIVVRRTKYDLEAAKEREHILTGLVIAIRAIDEVVAIIKKAASQAEAKSELKKRFGLTDRQAQAVLDLRLGRLTHLDVFKLEGDLAELQKQITYYNKILASKKEQMNVVKSEITAIKRVYKEPRRTELYKTKEEFVIPSEDDVKPVENFVVACNSLGELKRIPQKSFSLASRDFSDKSSPKDICPMIMPVKTGQVLYCFTNRGNCYKIDVDSIPEAKWRDKGTKLSQLAMTVDNKERIVNAFVIEDKLPKGKLLMYTAQGMIKQSDWKEYAVVKSCFQAMKLKEGDTVINVEQLKPDTTVMMITEQGMCINADRSDIPDQGRIAGGVRGINLSDGDRVICAEQAEPNNQICLVTDRAFAKRVEVSTIDVMVRYRKGVKIMDTKTSDGQVSSLLFAKIIKEPTDLVLEQEGGFFMQFNTEDLRLEARTTKGRAICKIPKTEKIQSVTVYKK